MKLEDFGFSTWFQENSDSTLLNSTRPARVISVNRDQYMIKNELVKYRPKSPANFCSMPNQHLTTQLSVTGCMLNILTIMLLQLFINCTRVKQC